MLVFQVSRVEMKITEIYNTEQIAAEGEEGWYAVRALYNRELKLKAYFDAERVENYIPMRYVRDAEGRRKLEPAIHSLMFVRSAFRRLKEIQNGLEGKWPIRIYTDLTTHRPMAIPEQQMRNFIAVTSLSDESLEYFEGGTFSEGDEVRITGGVFEGCRGILQRVSRRKRLVVSINGIAAVATAYIPSRYIEKL